MTRKPNEARSSLMPGVVYRVGDIVTYWANDRHRIIAADDDMIEVECVEAGDDPLWKVGDREVALCRRYTIVPSEQDR